MNILNKITVIIIDLLHSSCQTLGGLVLCTKPQNKILGRLQHLFVKDHEDESNLVECSVFCTFNDDNVDENALLIIFFYLSSNILDQLLVLIPLFAKILLEHYNIQCIVFSIGTEHFSFLCSTIEFGPNSHNLFQTQT